MLKFKQINNLYKSDRPSVSSKKTKINDINPKPQPRKHSSTVIGWTPELKETDCQYASAPGHRHVSAVLPKKTVVRKLSKAIELRESKAAYKQNKEPNFMESRYPVVYRTEITSSNENIYGNRLRNSKLEYPRAKSSSVGSQKKFQEFCKLSEGCVYWNKIRNKRMQNSSKNNGSQDSSTSQDTTDNGAGQYPKKKLRVSFTEDLVNSRLPSSVPGIDVCGLTIVIRDAKKMSAPLIDTKN